MKLTKMSLACLAISTALFASNAFAAKNIKIPNTLALDNPINVGLQAFADDLKARTNGELTVTIIPNGVLGGD